MSTTFARIKSKLSNTRDTGSVSLTSFSGGINDGRCLQVTAINLNDSPLQKGYAYLNMEGAIKLRDELNRFISGEQLTEV